MRKVLLVILMFIVGLAPQTFSQTPIDLVNIKRITQDSTQEYYYPRLVDEFVKSPEYFPLAKGVHIYYGQLYSKGYKVFNLTEDRTDFNKFLQRQNLRKAIPIGEKLLAENPIDMEILSKMSFCYDREGQQELAAKLKSRISVLHRVILSSGDGDRFESPYKVVAVPDEYVIMGIERMEGISRQSKPGLNSTVDIWSVKLKGSQEQKPLCFEVLRNMDAMSGFNK